MKENKDHPPGNPKQKDLHAQRKRIGHQLDQEYIHLAKAILETTEKHHRKIDELVDSLIDTDQKIERRQQKHKAPEPKTTK